MTFQAKLTTKLQEFSVGETIIELNKDIDKEQLNNIVKSILIQQNKLDESQAKTLTFDFLVGGLFLQVSVEKHFDIYSDELDGQAILNEKLVHIEYILSERPPEPLDALPHDDWVSSIDANDLYIISGSYDKSVRIFSIKDKKQLLLLSDAHEKPVTRVRWLKNSDLAGKNELCFVTCGHDEVSVVRSFNTKNNKSRVILTLKGHNRSVNCIDCSDNLVATGGFDRTLRVWSVGISDENGKEASDDENIESKTPSKRNKKQKTKSSEKLITNTTRSPMLTLTGHQEVVTGVKWLGECNDFKSLATCSADKSICIWDVEVGECKRRLLSSKPLLGLDYNSDSGLIIGASCDRHIRAWDARVDDNATAKLAFTSHTKWVSSVAFGKESKNLFVSGGYDNVVKMWDLRSTKASLYDLIGHHDKVLDINWNNPRYILSGSADSSMKIFATNK